MRGQLPDPSSDAPSVREQAIGTPETLKVGKRMADQGSSPMVDGHSGTSVLNSVHYKHVAGEGTPS